MDAVVQWLSILPLLILLHSAVRLKATGRLLLLHDKCHRAAEQPKVKAQRHGRRTCCVGDVCLNGLSAHYHCTQCCAAAAVKIPPSRYRQQERVDESPLLSICWPAQIVAAEGALTPAGSLTPATHTESSPAGRRKVQEVRQQLACGLVRTKPCHHDLQRLSWRRPSRSHVHVCKAAERHGLGCALCECLAGTKEPAGGGCKKAGCRLVAWGCATRGVSTSYKGPWGLGHRGDSLWKGMIGGGNVKGMELSNTSWCVR